MVFALENRKRRVIVRKKKEKSKEKWPEKSYSAPVPRQQISTTIQSAVQFHREGDLKKAEMGYRQILHNDPRNSEALDLETEIKQAMERT